MREIPYVVMEGALTRAERTVRRLWILCILLIVLLVGTNALWIVYEKQFETYCVEQDVETDKSENTTVIGVGDYGKD